MQISICLQTLIPLISVWSGEWGTFMFILFFFFQTIVTLPHGRGLHRCLNFWGVGIGLLLGEVGGLGFLFPVPPVCSLSDHFLLLSVHKYKKKKYICINF